MRIYVADSGRDGRRGAVHVLDTVTGARVARLNAGYCPTVAASARRRHLFVAHSIIRRSAVVGHEIVVYDARNLREKGRAGFENRFLYNVAPTNDEMVATESGDRCYITRCQVLGDDEARYEIAALDVVGRRTEFAAGRLQLPEAPNAFALLPRRSASLWFDASGRHLEAVGADRFRDRSSRPARFFVTAEPDTAAEHQRDHAFASVAAVALPNGRGVVHVSRDGWLRIAAPKTGQLSEPVRLELGDLRVPLQKALAYEDRVLLGAAPEEAAARGQIAMVFELRVGHGVFRERAFDVGPAVEKIRLSPAADQLVTLSREERTIRVLDLVSLAPSLSFEGVGNAPVQFALSR